VPAHAHLYCDRHISQQLTYHGIILYYHIIWGMYSTTSLCTLHTRRWQQHAERNHHPTLLSITPIISQDTSIRSSVVFFRCRSGYVSCMKYSHRLSALNNMQRILKAPHISWHVHSNLSVVSDSLWLLKFYRLRSQSLSLSFSGNLSQPSQPQEWRQSIIRTSTCVCRLRIRQTCFLKWKTTSLFPL